MPRPAAQPGTGQRARLHRTAARLREAGAGVDDRAVVARARERSALPAPAARTAGRYASIGSRRTARGVLVTAAAGPRAARSTRSAAAASALRFAVRPRTAAGPGAPAAVPRYAPDEAVERREERARRQAGDHRRDHHQRDPSRRHLWRAIDGGPSTRPRPETGINARAASGTSESPDRRPTCPPPPASRCICRRSSSWRGRRGRRSRECRTYRA
jgi:hypothetical protein